MLEELKEIICEYVDVDPDTITENSSLRNDIGATSFDLMNIAVRIEEEYHISVSNSVLPRVKTVGDIMNLMKNQDLCKC